MSILINSFVLIFLLLNSHIVSQEVPEKLKLKLGDISKGNYKEYNQLLARFINNDTTLTDRDVYLLSFGCEKKSKMKLIEQNLQEEKLYLLNNKREYKKAEMAALQYLKKYPLSLRGNLELAYSYKRMNDEINQNKYYQKYKMIMNSMLMWYDQNSDSGVIRLINPVNARYFLLFKRFSIKDDLNFEKMKEGQVFSVNAVSQDDTALTKTFNFKIIRP